MDTQWIYIEGTPVALDLNPLPGILDILEIDKKDRKEILYKLRIIEAEALKELSKHRKKQSPNGNK